MKGVWEKHILHHILVSSTLSILSCLPGGGGWGQSRNHSFLKGYLLPDLYGGKGTRQ